MVSPETIARRTAAGLCFTAAATGAVGRFVINSGQHPQVIDFLALLPLGVIGCAGVFALTGHLLAGNAAGYVQRRVIGAALSASMAALLLYDAVAKYLHATGGDILSRPHIDRYHLLAVLFTFAGGIVLLRVAWRCASAARDGMYLVGLDLSPASPDTIRAFMQVVEAVRAFGNEDRKNHQSRYNAYVQQVDVEEAAEHAIAVAEMSGRVVFYDRSTAWPELEEISDMVGGSSDVALAVLVRDLLNDDDFDTLTRWWAQPGRPLPAPATDTHYTGVDDNGLPIHLYEDGKLRSDPYHPIHQRQAVAELAHVLALRGFWMVRDITGKLKTWHRNVLVKRYNDTNSRERAEAVKEAHALALVSGRLAEAGGNPERIIAKDEFLGTVAEALLVRDLIGEERFTLIVAHWVAEGLPAHIIGTAFPQQAIGVYRDVPYCMTCALTNIPAIADGVLMGAADAKHAGSACAACGETLPGDPARGASVLTGRIASTA